MSRIGCPPTHTKLVRLYPLRIAVARTHACIRLRDPSAPVSSFLSFASFYHSFLAITLRWSSSYFFFFRLICVLLSPSRLFLLLIRCLSRFRSLFSFESFSFIIFGADIFTYSPEKRKKEEKVECRKCREKESEMKQK